MNSFGPFYNDRPPSRESTCDNQLNRGSFCNNQREKFWQTRQQTPWRAQNNFTVCQRPFVGDNILPRLQQPRAGRFVYDKKYYMN